jgi:hypothetical protein
MSVAFIFLPLLGNGLPDDKRVEQQRQHSSTQTLLAPLRMRRFLEGSVGDVGHTLGAGCFSAKAPRMPLLDPRGFLWFNLASHSMSAKQYSKGSLNGARRKSTRETVE